MNIHGVGLLSDPITIRACVSPDKMSPVDIVMFNTQVQFSWTEPDDNGCVITEYDFKVLNMSGVSTYVNLSECDATTVPVFGD